MHVRLGISPTNPQIPIGIYEHVYEPGLSNQLLDLPRRRQLLTLFECYQIPHAGLATDMPHSLQRDPNQSNKNLHFDATIPVTQFLLLVHSPICVRSHQ